MSKVIYIGGYGRSGSTILSIILGNHPNIVNIGEATYLLQDWNNSNYKCSCGVPYRECKFWKDLFVTSPESEIVQSIQNLEKVWSIPRLLLGLLVDEERQAYHDYQSRLFDYVRDHTGKRIIVDSSKSAWAHIGRFWLLDRLVGQNVYVLHLIRDGLDVMKSRVLTGSNLALQGHSHNPRFTSLRSTLGWTTTNMWTSLLGNLLGPDRYMLVSYEDLVARPNKVLESIGQFCSFDPEALVERINYEDHFAVGHIVRGNRIRSEQKIKFRRKSGRDKERHLPLHQRLLFLCVGGWLRHYYGYK